jgi:flagellar biosynthesis regulator FlaF
MCLTLEDGRNIATIMGTAIALGIYITNSIQQLRQRRVENALRFIAAHQRLWQTPFIAKNLHAMEAGAFSRTSWNEVAEDDFSKFLGDLEELALLLQAGIVSQQLSIYMFGWVAQKIQPILTAKERDNVYWELAVQCLDELKDAADDFYKKTKAERQQYHGRDHFKH